MKKFKSEPQRFLDRWNLPRSHPITARQQVIWRKCDDGNAGPEKPAGKPFYFTVSIKAVLIIWVNLLCYPEITYSCNIILWLLKIEYENYHLAENLCPQYQNPLFSEDGCDMFVLWEKRFAILKNVTHRTALRLSHSLFFFLFSNPIYSKISWNETFLVYLHKKYRLWYNYLA